MGVGIKQIILLMTNKEGKRLFVLVDTNFLSRDTNFYIPKIYKEEYHNLMFETGPYLHRRWI